jgi:Uma2 family endonuclease
LRIPARLAARYYGLSDRLIERQTMPTGVILTYRDYEALPADGRRYELHDGQLIVTAAPGVPHQRVVGRLFVLLRQHVEEHRLGEVFVAPVDCILSETTVVQPDLVYLESGRSALVSARGIEGPPTLAVEIVSPSTAQVDRGAKLQLYGRHGIGHYWIVDPEQRSIEAYAAVDGGFRVIARLTGSDRGSLPPFSSLPIAAAVWS